MAATGAIPKKQKLAPIQVFLRIRPSNAQDGPSAIVDCTPTEIHVKGHSRGYHFDQIFDENTTQLKVYKTVVGKMIDDVVKGYNCTVFAYGQTGTGKTYTILGGDTMKSVDEKFDWQQDSDAGIILRAAMHLYEEFEKIDPNIQRTVTVSFMEIYNEEIRDLLCDKELVPLRLYEDKSKVVRVKNLSEITVLSPWEIFCLLKKGCEKRQVASTLMNNLSSRSHTVFTINVSIIQTVSVAESLSNITCGKLNLIDLAGSENIAKAGSKEQRAREASNINQSLLTLGRVIKALVENSSHVPYRESKLTRILQDSLGGKTKTSIIATVSPGITSLDETANTLEYAHNARHVTNCPIINLRTSATAAAVNEELLRLKRDLFATANEQGIYMDRGNYEEITKSLMQYKKDVVNKLETINALTEKVEDLTAQKEDWENLRASFELTSRAYRECQTEIETNRSIMQKDSLLLDYYESESAKLQEHTEAMLQRQKILHQKVDSLYTSSINNQNILELIIKMIEKSMDELIDQDSEHSSELTRIFTRLMHCNDEICHMLNNLKGLTNNVNKYKDKLELVKVDGSDSEDPFDVKLMKVCKHSVDLENKLKSFIEKCDDKFRKVNLSIDEIHIHIQNVKRLVKQFHDCTLLRVTEKEAQTIALCDEDRENWEKLCSNVKEKLSNRLGPLLRWIDRSKSMVASDGDRMSHVTKNLEEDLEYLTRRRKRFNEDLDGLQEDYESLNRRKKEIQQIEEKLEQRGKRLKEEELELSVSEKKLNQCRENCEKEQERIKRREEMIVELKKIIDFEFLNVEIENYDSAHSKIRPEIAKFHDIKEVLSSCNEDFESLEQVGVTISRNMEKINLPPSDDIIVDVRTIPSNTWEVLEYLMDKLSADNCEQANALDQISQILRLEGVSDIKRLEELLSTHSKHVKSLGEQTKANINHLVNTSIVKVSHKGDTPRKLDMSFTSHRSSRDSLVRKLTLDTCAEEQNSVTEEKPGSSHS